MTGIDQPTQTIRVAVGNLRRIWINAVIAPITHSRKLSNRHQFKGGDTQVFQRAQKGNNRVKRALVGECPDVKLVEDVIFERNSSPISILPGEVWYDDLGRAMNPLR